MSDRGTVAITGANGYVGRELSLVFAALGYQVIALQRSIPPSTDAQDHIPYSLEEGPALPLPDDTAAVVHCAYNLHARDRSEIARINLGGVEKLVETVGSVPIVLISSMSAYPGTEQLYGRNKLACEELVTAHGGTSLRLGLVYGGADGGMIGTLRNAVALPLVPVLRPDSYQYTVHADDMARCVVATVEQPPPHRVIGVANPRQVPFSEIIRTLRATATSKPPRTITLPSALLYGALRATEAAGFRAGFRADSMLGLMHPAPGVPHVEYWAEQGISLRDFTAATAP